MASFMPLAGRRARPPSQAVCAARPSAGSSGPCGRRSSRACGGAGLPLPAPPGRSRVRAPKCDAPPRTARQRRRAPLGQGGQRAQEGGAWPKEQQPEVAGTLGVGAAATAGLAVGLAGGAAFGLACGTGWVLEAVRTRPCKTLGLYYRSLSPLRFWCKKRSKRPTREVWREPPDSLVFWRKQAPDAHFALIPFSAWKSRQVPSRRACHRSSPLRHRSLLGRKSAQKRPSSRVPEEIVLRRVFRGTTACQGPWQMGKIKLFPATECSSKQPSDLVVPLVPCTGIFLGPSKSGKCGADQHDFGAILRSLLKNLHLQPQREWLDPRRGGPGANTRAIIQRQRKITETSKKLEMKKLHQVLIILDDYADSPQLHTLFIRGRRKSAPGWPARCTRAATQTCCCASAWWASCAVGCDQLLRNDVNCTTCSPRVWTPRARSPARRSQPPAPSQGPRCRPQGPCQAAR